MSWSAECAFWRRMLQTFAVEAAVKSERRRCWFYDFGDRPVPYEPVRRWQLQLRAARGCPRGAARELYSPKRCLPDVLMLLTHVPVYTLGTAANAKDLRFALHESPCAVTRTERGGKVTYHGPGQVTGYAIMDLCKYRRDLRWYVSMLEEVVIRSLGEFGISGERFAGHHGVWVGGATRKIATIGVSASRWITCHGFALNVTRDVLEPFRRIVACGLDGDTMTCMHELVPDRQTCTVEKVRQTLAIHFAQVFDVVLEPYKPELRSLSDDKCADEERQHPSARR
ncbi:hypothetical protein CCYA_CCYA14G3739 [Cyanidiococcus yangmingshanensis]|nr:hypothetical protein CCYA_CCYA14G3739 [Cyanidiococcus yangmingshanensis]